MIPLADGLGTSADETAALFLLFLALGLAIAGWVRLPKRDGTQATVGHRVPPWIMFFLATAVLAGAFTLPRYLRPRAVNVRPRTAVTIELLEPARYAVVHGRSLHIMVRVIGGRVIRSATTDLRPDEGHLHVSIDGVLSGTAFSEDGEIDISTDGAGDHLLRVEFVAGDHAPFSNRQIVERLFRVER